MTDDEPQTQTLQVEPILVDPSTGEILEQHPAVQQAIALVRQEPTDLELRSPQMSKLSLRRLITVGTILARSGYFADAQTANQAVAKMLAGQELGVGEMASMQNIHVIKGRITLAAQLMASLIKRAKPRYDYRLRESSSETCTISFFEDGEAVGDSTFTIQMARRAGLVKADSNWAKWPEDMLFSRAISRGFRRFCPNLSMFPVYTPDELEDAVDLLGAGNGEEEEERRQSGPPKRVSFVEDADNVVEGTSTEVGEAAD